MVIGFNSEVQLVGSITIFGNSESSRLGDGFNYNISAVRFMME